MFKSAKKIKVKVTLLEEMLGMMPNSQEIYAEYIASKAPDAVSVEEEIFENGIEAVTEKGRTVFPKLTEPMSYNGKTYPTGTPFVWDYQIKGAFKDAFGMLRRMPGSECGKRKAYKKEIDGLLFVYPRKIPITIAEGGKIGICDRPLRASTPQGERIAIASSETVPADSSMEFEVVLLEPGMEKAVNECSEYFSMRGFGGWRNSGKGAALWEELD